MHIKAFCLNYTAVRLYAGAAWFCVKQQWRTGEPPLHR